MMGPTGLSAIRAVLPAETDVFAVGGVDAPDFDAWHKVGATGFGLGSSLYKPGRSAAEINDRARQIVAAFDTVYG